MPRTSGVFPAGLNRIFLLLAPLTLAGCAIQAHDAAFDRYRLAENLKPAEVLAKKLAITDLNCTHIKTQELSGKNVEGAPMGPVWRDYIIQTTGCGRAKNYVIQCEGDSDCRYR